MRSCRSGALSSLDLDEAAHSRRRRVAAQARSSLQQPVGRRAWADELYSRPTMMTEKGAAQSVVVRLSPEHLGPCLEVRISRCVMTRRRYGSARHDGGACRDRACAAALCASSLRRRACRSPMRVCSASRRNSNSRTGRAAISAAAVRDATSCDRRAPLCHHGVRQLGFTRRAYA